MVDHTSYYGTPFAKFPPRYEIPPSLRRDGERILTAGYTDIADRRQGRLG